MKNWLLSSKISTFQQNAGNTRRSESWATVTNQFCCEDEDLHLQFRLKETTVGCHLTPVRMAAIKKSTNNKRWKGCSEKGSLLHCWWECKLVQPLWRTVWRFLKKRNRTATWPSNSEETTIERETCTPMLIAALFTIARTWKQPECPSAEEGIRRRIRRRDIVVHIHNGISFSY